MPNLARCHRDKPCLPFLALARPRLARRALPRSASPTSPNQQRQASASTGAHALPARPDLAMPSMPCLPIHALPAWPFRPVRAMPANPILANAPGHACKAIEADATMAHII
jgi:hypothetical protein